MIGNTGKILTACHSEIYGQRRKGEGWLISEDEIDTENKKADEKT